MKIVIVGGCPSQVMDGRSPEGRGGGRDVGKRLLMMTCGGLLTGFGVARTRLFGTVAEALDHVDNPSRRARACVYVCMYAVVRHMVCGGLYAHVACDDFLFVCCSFRAQSWRFTPGSNNDVAIEFGHCFSWVFFFSGLKAARGGSGGGGGGIGAFVTFVNCRSMRFVCKQREWMGRRVIR